MRQEEKSGVTYQEIQRQEAEEVMASGVHGTSDDRDEDTAAADDDSGKDERQELTDKKRRFDAEREAAEQEADGKPKGKDSVAEDAMMSGTKLSEEVWEGDAESEKDNFVQEELYIHGKLLIVDDRTVICGSSNINDRVSGHLVLLNLESRY